MKNILKLIVLTITILLVFTACGDEKAAEPDPTTEPVSTEQTTADETTTETTTEKELPKEPVTMKVTCTSTTSDGKLLTKCAATYANGQNLVPGISWDAVDGAKAYAVYILDESASNWLHLKTITTTNSIKEGENISGQYVGPYPPSGTHNYTIYVLALKDAPSTLQGNFDSTNGNISSLTQNLTILGQGSTTVKYANGDNNV